MLIRIPPSVMTYTTLHYSRRRLITSPEALQQKKDMVAALSDIELALSMQKAGAGASDDIHPLEQAYTSLTTDLEAVPTESEEFEMIRQYADNTTAPCASGQGGWIGASTVKRQLLDVFRVNRHGEVLHRLLYSSSGPSIS